MKKTARSPSQGRTAKRPYHHGDLRRALLDAAFGLLSPGSSVPFTLREVARRAGVTHAAPYRHFADKQALLAAVAEEGFRGLLTQIERRMAPYPPGSFERFRACGEGYVLHAVEHPTHFRVMFGPGLLSAPEGEAPLYPGLEEAGGEAFQTLVTCIEEAQAAGKMRPSDTLRLAVAAWSRVHGLAMLLVDGQLSMLEVGPEKAAETASRVCHDLLTGLGARS
jgi:AcrR family transcriptional regulator